MRSIHASEDGIRRALKEQLYRPVRWADTVRAMIAAGATTLVECGPGKVLTTLNRRVERRPDLAMLALEDPATLESRARDLRGEADMSEQPTAVVTGASRGIGRAIALELARRGARIVGTATSDAGAAAITEGLADGGADRSRRGARRRAPADSVEAFFKALDAAEGTPAILVNNAGVTRDGLLMRMSAEDWQAVLETDLSSVYRTCKAVMRGMMKARYGRIINIASVIAVMGNAGQSNYAAAKAGMIGFSKSLAREVGSRGITVNVVAPGFIATDMTEALDEKTRSGAPGAGPARPPRVGRRHRARRRLPRLARRPATSPARHCMSMAVCT